MQQSELISLAAYIAKVSNLISQPRFQTLLKTPRSRFKQRFIPALKDRLFCDFIGATINLLPHDDYRRYRALKFSGLDHELLPGYLSKLSRALLAVSQQLASELRTKDKVFRCHQGQHLTDGILSLMSFERQHLYIGRLNELKEPHHRHAYPDSLSYVTDALQGIRSYCVSIRVLQRKTSNESYEKALAWAIAQGKQYWLTGYPHDLLVHDFDELMRKQKGSSGLLGFKLHYLSTKQLSAANDGDEQRVVHKLIA